MRTARLRVVRGGGEGGVVTWSQMGGWGVSVVTWSRGGGEGGVVTWSRGGGRKVLSPGPKGEGGRCCPETFGVALLLPPVGTWFQVGGGGRYCDLVSWGEGRCCHLVLGRREGGVVTWSRGGGRKVLFRDLWCCTPPSPPRWTEWVTHACKNITFARFATRAVINNIHQSKFSLSCSFSLGLNTA